MDLKEILGDNIWGISLAGSITTPKVRTTGYVCFSGFFYTNREMWQKKSCGFITRITKGEVKLIGKLMNLEIVGQNLSVRTVLKSSFGGHLNLDYELSSPVINKERNGLSLRGRWINGLCVAPAGCSMYLPEKKFDLWSTFNNLQKQI